MRTTLTLDEDVAAKLKAEVRRSGRSFRDILNDTLRQGFATRRAASRQTPFEVGARDLGQLLPGLALDSAAALLEQVEGPLYR